MANCEDCGCYLDSSLRQSANLCFECEENYQPFKSKGTAVDPLSHNVGSSNYSQKKIQPWDLWEEYKLNPWDADIVKRILRTKILKGMTPTEARIEDYEKIIHICQYRVAKLKGEL